ncbi:hypothetical protein VNO80_07672 [Phaseolus coccineus]|uniref:Uncharacterized protein n=1 Tax=Phaseolus coccineus TaxID=3886 RepID=A0AAN9NPL4_PHACN
MFFFLIGNDTIYVLFGKIIHIGKAMTRETRRVVAENAWCESVLFGSVVGVKGKKGKWKGIVIMVSFLAFGNTRVRKLGQTVWLNR